MSLVMVLVSLLSMAFGGLNLGIDFAGGVLIDFHCKNVQLDIVGVRHDVRSLFANGVVYVANGEGFVIKARLKQDKGDNASIEEMKDVLAGRCGGRDEIEYSRVGYVGSQVSQYMVWTGVAAICSALAGVMLYLCARFNFFFALGGLVTLVHDVILLFGFYSITRLEFNLSSVAAVLTIIGYSINDTVVIYDSIRDQLKHAKHVDLKAVINISVNRTLARTIFTSLTTFIAAMVLVIMCGEVIRPFSWAVAFGLFIGTYSSVVISSQCLLWTRRLSPV